MVGTWTQDAFPGAGSTDKAIGVAVTFNGGNTWKTGVIPEITLSTGGNYQAGADSWLSFAPNGDLYFSCLGISARTTNGGHVSYDQTAVLTEKSTDGGLTWSAPITLVQSNAATTFNDKESITADPTASGYAYVVWSQLTSNGGPAMLSRTTDGGQSWSTPSTIFDPGGGTDADPNQIVVLPNGNLVDFMDTGRYQNSKKIQTLSLIQSPDKGQTWTQNPVQVADMLSIGVTDPDTGQPVDSQGGTGGVFSAAVDPHNGYLYAVWQDARFSNSQYDGIAFSMSRNGGITWSAPIQINQTPTNIPAGDRQAFNPAIAVADDGSVGVTYYDFRFNDASPGLRTDYWLVAARPGTDLTNPPSWRTEARMTNASFDLEKAGVWAGRGYFVGDYQGFAAAGNSFNAFFSMPNGNDPADIYFRDPPFDDGGTPIPNVLVNDPTEDTIPMQDTQSETAIVLGAGSKVVVAYNDTGLTSLGFPGLAGYSTSANGGATFADKGSLNHNAGDPVLARSSKTGTIFLSTIGVDNAYVNPTPPPPVLPSGLEKVNVFRSTNNGLTFQDPVNGTPGFLSDIDTQDKPWIAVDNFPGPGQGNVYLAWCDFSFNPNNNGLYLARSVDDGITWKPENRILLANNGRGAAQGANVVVGPDHAVYVFWLDESKGLPNPVTLRMRKSTDEGQTFGDAVVISNIKSQGVNGDVGLTDAAGRTFRTNAFPQAAINPVTGDIYLAYTDQPNGSKDKADVFFTESTDAGMHWSKPLRVNDDATNNDQWFPALAVTPDGSHVGLFWYDRRLDPADNLIDRFGAIGTISGHTVTFGANFRITDVSFPPAYGQDPISLSPAYMGDYDQATADNSYFYTTWGDNRTGDQWFANQPDVRLAKIAVGWTGAVSTLAALADPGGASAVGLRVADGTPFALSSGAAAVAVADPGAPLSRAGAWNVLTVDAYFIDLARTSQATAGITSGDTAPQHAFGQTTPALPGAREPVVLPPARVTDTPTLALARRTTQRPADEWATDDLISRVPWWDGEADI
jgi:hypothetical protein